MPWLLLPGVRLYGEISVSLKIFGEKRIFLLIRTIVLVDNLNGLLSESHTLYDKKTKHSGEISIRCLGFMA